MSETYTAEKVRAEISPEDRQRCIEEFQASPAGGLPFLREQVTEVFVAGEWYAAKLRSLGVDEWSRALISFNFGRACLGRDPYEMAAKAFNAFVGNLPPAGTVANNERVYDEQIAPLMDQIIAICKEHKLPVFAAFQYVEDGMCTTALLNVPGAHLALVSASRLVINRNELPKR